MDVQFDNAQELNSFHVKARGLFKCIDGVQLCLQTIKVEADSEIVSLLYLRNCANFLDINTYYSTTYKRCSIFT